MKIIFDVVKNDVNFEPFDVKQYLQIFFIFFSDGRGAVSFVPFNIALYDKGIINCL